jgi:hypothetical protein
MLLPVLLLLAASCTVPVDGAGAKGRKLPGANSSRADRAFMFGGLGGECLPSR